MRALNTIVLIVGILAVLGGLLWIGQGTGYFPYPKSSFMINERPWIWRGVVLAVAGVGAILVSRRRRA